MMACLDASLSQSCMYGGVMQQWLKQDWRMIAVHASRKKNMKALEPVNCCNSAVALVGRGHSWVVRVKTMAPHPLRFVGMLEVLFREL